MKNLKKNIQSVSFTAANMAPSVLTVDLAKSSAFAKELLQTAPVTKKTLADLTTMRAYLISTSLIKNYGKSSKATDFIDLEFLKTYGQIQRPKEAWAFAQLEKLLSNRQLTSLVTYSKNSLTKTRKKLMNIIKESIPSSLQCPAILVLEKTSIQNSNLIFIQMILY